MNINMYNYFYNNLVDLNNAINSRWPQSDDRVSNGYDKPLPLSLRLPNEVWKVIFSGANFKELRNCSLVDKKWNQLTNDPMLVKKMIYEEYCFNPSHWNEFCGVGTVLDDEIAKAYASLPKDIREILKSDYNGQKVIDTHMLVWIPETIKGKPITIDNFGALLKAKPEFCYNATGYRVIWDEIVQQEGSKLVKSGWVLMTTDVISGSRKKSFAEQKLLVESLNKNGQTGYRVPKTAEAIICIAAQYLRSKESKKRLFSDEPWTFTRCQENVQGLQTMVGGFAPSGLSVWFTRNDDRYGAIGVAGLREF